MGSRHRWTRYASHTPYRGKHGHLLSGGKTWVRIVFPAYQVLVVEERLREQEAEIGQDAEGHGS
jgi:hypothetical protein